MKNVNEIYDFLKEVGTYYLATIDNNGKPRVRPFGTVDIYNGKITIQTGLKKDVAKQMIANHNIEICAFKEGKWIRVNAVVTLDDSVEASDHMLNNYPYLRNMYTPGDGNCCVFVLEKGSATFASFGAEAKVIEF